MTAPSNTVMQVLEGAVIVVDFNNVQMTLSRVIVEMVADVGGHFSPAGLDCSHTCLYYSLPIQHITVPWVLHTQ